MANVKECIKDLYDEIDRVCRALSIQFGITIDRSTRLTLDTEKKEPSKETVMLKSKKSTKKR